MAIPDPIPSKAALRSHMRRLARECPHDSTAVRAALDDWLTRHPGPRVIASFLPLTGEPDLTETAARHSGRMCVYPKVRGHELDFHRVENPATGLERGAFGILEPSPALERIGLERIDVFICPGLAFDARGGRLGRGKGFYDRTLSLAKPGALKIGVCFPYQIVDDTFTEPHDIVMDLVLW